jgi:ferritin
MLNQEMQDALNVQINEELYSAYLYSSMAAYFESINLAGCAAWMHAQTQEELLHAQKMYHYISERGGRVILEAIAKPQAEWDTPLAAFEAAAAHEQHITGCINTLVDKAIALSDHATKGFLDWFVSEQVEEEATVDAIVQQLKFVKDSPHALFMIDRELGTRMAPASVKADQN